MDKHREISTIYLDGSIRIKENNTVSEEKSSVIKEEIIEEDTMKEPDYFGNFEEDFVFVKKGLEDDTDREVIVKEEIEDFSDHISEDLDFEDQCSPECDDKWCTGCQVSFEKLIGELRGSDEKAVDMFATHGILPQSRKCDKCGHLCTLKPADSLFCCDRQVTDSENTESRCSFSISQFDTTWLSKVNTKTPNINLRFINVFLRKLFSVPYCVQNHKLSNDTVVEWRTLCSEVCAHWVENQPPIGGLGIEVEIGESTFRRSVPHCERKKTGVWVFGGIERESQTKFVVEVQDRTAETLLPLIQKFVKPLTVIFTDSNEAYEGISQLPQNYAHFRLNVPTHFMDCVDRDVHMKTIEKLWKEMKSLILRTVDKDYPFDQYLARYLFLSTHQNHQTVLHDFLLEIASMYPPRQHE